MHAVDRHQVFRVPSVWTVPILVRHHVGMSGSRSTVAIVASSVADVRTVRGRSLKRRTPVSR
jgi:hypothetical protein